MIRRHALLEREGLAGIHNDSSMPVIAYIKSHPVEMVC